MSGAELGAPLVNLLLYGVLVCDFTIGSLHKLEAAEGTEGTTWVVLFAH